MSELTEALEIIFNWLDTNQWSRFPGAENSASFLQPGLSRSEIDAIIASSNLVLPPEVYELYQWKNGERIDKWDYVGLFDIYHNFSGFGPWGFVPFQSAFTEYMKYESRYTNMKPENFSQASAVSSISNFHNLSAFQIFCGHEGCLTGQDSYYIIFRSF